MIKSIVPYTVLFFYIYAVPFVFLPVSTRVLFGVIGFSILMIELLQQKLPLKLNKQLAYFLILLFMIPLIALISIGINQTNDIEFIKYPISMITILFASYFVGTVLNKFYEKLNFQIVSSLIINIILIQSIIAFLMFVIPDLRDLLLGIQRLSPDDIEQMSNYFEFRIIGFGTMYFGAGVIGGFGLILIGALLRFYNLSSKKVLILSLKFLVILVIGMMMARTTLIGGLLGLMLIFVPKDLKATISMFRKRVFFITSTLLIPFISVILLYFIFPKVSEILEPVFNFAFEIFINYFENGSAESVSTNRLQEMYVFPENIKTWIIGDGYWENPFGSGYYMYTDVGYLRLIYYFGLVGLATFLIMQFIVIKNSFEHKLLIYTIFLYLIILNLKGFTDLISISLIFYLAILLRKRISSIE